MTSSISSFLFASPSSSSSSSSSSTSTFFARRSFRNQELAAAAAEEEEEEEQEEEEEEVEEEEEEEEDEEETDSSYSDESSSDSDESSSDACSFLYQVKHGSSLPTLVGVERPAGEMVATGIPPHVKNLALLEAARVLAREQAIKTEQRFNKIEADIQEVKQMIRDLSQQGLHPIGISAMKAMLTEVASSLGHGHAHEHPAA